MYTGECDTCQEQAQFTDYIEANDWWQDHAANAHVGELVNEADVTTTTGRS